MHCAESLRRTLFEHIPFVLEKVEIVHARHLLSLKVKCTDRLNYLNKQRA